MYVEIETNFNTAFLLQQYYIYVHFAIYLLVFPFYG